MSEIIEMYLAMIVQLRVASLPVPMALLASNLGVSQVSANEMCHRLEHKGLLTYQPYKGVTLTAKGETQAQAVLQRRQVWSRFLGQHLHIGQEEADELASRLGHVTSERLLGALRKFLLQPAAHRHETRTLASCAAGSKWKIVSLCDENAGAAFLRYQGLETGAYVGVLAVGTDGSMLLDLDGRQLALAAQLTDQIQVAPTHHTPDSCAA